jgi:hypothetical protein
MGSIRLMERTIVRDGKRIANQTMKFAADLKPKESGGNSKEVTPVPMPNTVVKLFCVDGSWGFPPARVERCRAYII